MNIQRVTIIFVLSWAFNMLWEYAHAIFYISYKGSTITEWILFRAAIADALIISTVYWCIWRWSPKEFRGGLIILFLCIIAIGIEWWALATGRWVYAASMPIIPWISVGLTPTIQLMVTWRLVALCEKRFFSMIQ